MLYCANKAKQKLVQKGKEKLSSTEFVPTANNNLSNKYNEPEHCGSKFKSTVANKKKKCNAMAYDLPRI